MLLRRLGPVGVVVTAYEAWKRLPERDRQRLLDEARKHGPPAARFVANHGKKLIERLRG
jgi:hypothetical protein